MYNTLNGVNVAEKLGLGPEIRELKFGSSFTSGGRGSQQGSFHTVRYDFKPASVDTSKPATLDVGPSNQITISMPNVDANATTVFKGARKPYAKECVLIIDQDTGEVILEKLTHNIQVKRTREEGGSKKSSAMTLPVAPPPVEMKKTLPPPSFSKADPKLNSREESKKAGPSNFPTKPMPPLQQHHQQPNPSKRGSNNTPMPAHSHQPRHSPKGPSPGRITSPPVSLSPSAGSQDSRHGKAQAQPNHFSLTDLDSLLSNPPAPPPTVPKPSMDKPIPKETSIHSVPLPKPSPGASSGAGNPKDMSLSESSSGDDSSSSSSSDDDDDDSSDMEEVPDKLPIPPVQESSLPPLPPVVNTANRGRPPIPAVAPSMPSDLLLDLQLSESGSDSD